MIIPEPLRANCRADPERQRWLERLPTLLQELVKCWSLRAGPPLENTVGTCAWIAPVVCADGATAILKLGMPHMEGLSEIAGLRFWNGNPTVRLIEGDPCLGAMLLERCQPGYSLKAIPGNEQDVVVATLLKRLWKRSASSTGLQQFRRLSEMLEYWRNETLTQYHQWSDAELVRDGLRVWESLGKPSSTDVLLATDLHAGNVLRSEREPWLVIDPKPFVGDPAYDVVQHLRNCEARLHADPIALVNRLADLCEIDKERLRLWTFARAAADPRPNWRSSQWIEVAKALAP